MSDFENNSQINLLSYENDKFDDKNHVFVTPT